MTLLRELGVETIDDIPDHVTLTPVQRRVKDNREWIGEGLADRLSKSPISRTPFGF